MERHQLWLWNFLFSLQCITKAGLFNFGNIADGMTFLFPSLLFSFSTSVIPCCSFLTIDFCTNNHVIDFVLPDFIRHNFRHQKFFLTDFSTQVWSSRSPRSPLPRGAERISVLEAKNGYHFFFVSWPFCVKIISLPAWLRYVLIYSALQNASPKNRLIVIQAELTVSRLRSHS